MQHRLDASAFKMRPDLPQASLRDRLFETDRPWPQCRTGDGQAPAQNHAGVELAFDAALHCDDHQASVLSQAIQFARHIVSRHHVEHHVNTPALRQGLDFPYKVELAVVDRMVSPQGDTGSTLLITARCDDDTRAHGLGELDRCHPDAARAALHQQRLTGLQSATVEHIAPDREHGLRQGRRLGVGPALGHRQALPDWSHAIFGITATCNQGTHALPQRQAGRRQLGNITLHHGTRNLQPRNVGGTRRHRIVAGALQHIGSIHAAGTHPHQQFTRTSNWCWPLRHTQHLGCAESGYFNHLHGHGATIGGATAGLAPGSFTMPYQA